MMSSESKEVLQSSLHEIQIEPQIQLKKNEVKKMLARTSESVQSSSMIPLRPPVLKANFQGNSIFDNALDDFYGALVEIRTIALEKSDISMKLFLPKHILKKSGLGAFIDLPMGYTENIQKKKRINEQLHKIVDSLEKIAKIPDFQNAFVRDTVNRDALNAQIFSIILDGREWDVYPVMLAWLEAISTLKAVEKEIIVLFKWLCNIRIEPALESPEDALGGLQPAYDCMKLFLLEPNNVSPMWDSVKPLSTFGEIPLFYRHALQFLNMYMYVESWTYISNDYKNCLPFIHMLRSGADKQYFPDCFNISESVFTDLDLSALPNYLLSQLHELALYSHVIDSQYSYQLDIASGGMQNNITGRLRLHLMILQFDIFGKNSHHTISKKNALNLLTSAKEFLENYGASIILNLNIFVRIRALIGISEFFQHLEKLDCEKPAQPVLLKMQDLLVTRLWETGHYATVEKLLKQFSKGGEGGRNSLSNNQIKIQFTKLSLHLTFIMKCMRYFPMTKSVETTPNSDFWMDCKDVLQSIDNALDFHFELIRNKYSLFSYTLISMLQKVSTKIESQFRLLSASEQKKYKKEHVKIQKIIYYLAQRFGASASVIDDIASIFKLDLNTLSNQQTAALLSKESKKKSKQQKVTTNTREVELKEEVPDDVVDANRDIEDEEEAILTLARRSEPKPVSVMQPVQKVKKSTIEPPKEQVSSISSDSKIKRKIHLNNNSKPQSLATVPTPQAVLPKTSLPIVATMQADPSYHPSGKWAGKVIGDEISIDLESKSEVLTSNLDSLPAFDPIDEHMQRVLNPSVAEASLLNDAKRFVPRELLPPAILNLFETVMPEWCIFLVGSTVTDYLFRLPHYRDYDFCVFGKKDLKMLHDMLLEYPDTVKNLQIRRKKSSMPILHFDVCSGGHSYEVDIVYGKFKPGETIFQAMQRRIKEEADFNVFALILDITRSISQKEGFWIGGNIDIRNISAVGDRDTIFSSDPRRLFARVIKAKYYYHWLEYSDHLQGLLANKKETFDIVTNFFDPIHPEAVLHAENLSTDLEYLLQHCFLSCVLERYEATGVMWGITQVDPNYLKEALKFVPCHENTSTYTNNIFFARQKMLAITFFYANVIFYNKYFTPYKDVMDALRNSPLLTLIKPKCIGYAYSMYAQYINSLAHGREDTVCLYDPSFQKMVKSMDKYYCKLKLQYMNACNTSASREVSTPVVGDDAVQLTIPYSTNTHILFAQTELSDASSTKIVPVSGAKRTMQVKF